MFLENAYKDKQTLKCKSYDETIKDILSGFRKMGLNVVTHSLSKNRKINSYSYSSKIPELNFIQHGKGTTQKQALASALAELAERFSANLYFKRMYPDYNQIKNSRLLQFINREHLSCYTHSHQDDLEGKIRIEELLKNSNITFTKEQIDVLKNMDVAKHWVNGYSLLTKKPIKVPLRLIQIINRANGVASGNRVEEAIVHASCEIFERHSLIEVFAKKIITPTFDLSTIKDKTINKMIKNYERNNIRVLIKDFSLGNRFPVVAVVFINDNLKKSNSYNYKFEHIRVNAGASYNLNVAITRCFTEKIAGHGLSTFKKGYTSIYEDNLIKKLGAKVTLNESYLGLIRKARFLGDKKFLTKGKVIPFTQKEETYNFLTEIDYIKETCKKLRSDFVVVNLTHPILQFPTVRVIIPGYSSTINFLNYKFEDLMNWIKFGSVNTDFIHMHTDDKWLNIQKYQNFLERKILSDFIQVTDSKISTVSNELNGLKEGLLILASMYFNAKNYEKFNVVAKLISERFIGDLKKKYLYLYYLTNHYLKTKNEEMIPIINNAYKKLKGCQKFLYSKPMKNPFETWCDQECQHQCEEKYLATLNKMVESFFVNSKPNNENIQK
ncbi:MAG: hypothetical protein E3J70_05165 [Candidatus Heimdallarchaeota archaeon]|nr:MAG: hypothetical protein E3J70_05165 [Candidatus Heimdallarchaeota archaeon]